MIMHNILKVTSLFLVLLLLSSCNKKQKLVLRGEAQGTTYQISYFDKENRSFKHQIDSLFQAIDQSMSTYQDQSTISRWNRNETTEIDPYFKAVFTASQKVHKESQGYFDPSVGPLINLYGFGKDKKVNITTTKKDSVLKFVGMDKIQLNQFLLTKSDTRISLNFNAIAQGYTVDLIRDYLLKKGIQSFMVEVGGELYCNGTKPDGSNWIIAIDKPEQERGNDFQEYIKLENEAIATSGNYRKVSVNKITGEKYVHTINPLTGEAGMSSLISVTIIHKQCIYADAYATAILSMGLEKGVKFLQNNPNIKAYLIYQKGSQLMTYSMNNFDDSIQDLNNQ